MPYWPDAVVHTRQGSRPKKAGIGVRPRNTKGYAVQTDLERKAKKLTVKQMKAELGLDRTVRGHTRLTRDEVVKLWIELHTS